MKVDVVDMTGKKVKTADLPKEIFEAPIKPDLMHQAFVRQMSNARLGTRKTKGRGEVSGGGHKPWRQKGTGRARHGTRRSPIWVGGGKTHTPQPKSFAKKMPRKMRRAALRSALSVKASQGEIVVVDEWKVETMKTKTLAQSLQTLVGDASALLLTAKPDEQLEKPARNLPAAKTLNANYLNIRDLLQYDRVVMPLDAVEVIQSYLG